VAAFFRLNVDLFASSVPVLTAALERDVSF
jgi:hypothetical protein